MRNTPKSRPELRVPREILQLRHRGSRGGIIGKHRAFATLETSNIGVAVGVIAGAAFSFAVLLALPTIAAIWTSYFHLWYAALELPGEVITRSRGWRPFLTVEVPTLSIATPDVSAPTWWITFGAVGALLLISLPLARRTIPLAYLLRAIVLVQATALAYFAVAPDSFPYDIAGYIETMLLASLGFMVLLPLLLGFTYNIYDVGFRRKLLLVLLVELHAAVFFPHQYLLHGVLVHYGSALFLPLLYFLFGFLLDVVILVGWYAWGMSWPTVLKEGKPAVTAAPAGWWGR